MVLRATFYLFTGENHLALSDLDMVINNKEACARIKSNALIKRASIHMQLEDFTACTNDFNFAVATDEENSDIYHHRGQVNLLNFLILSNICLKLLLLLFCLYLILI